MGAVGAVNMLDIDVDTVDMLDTVDVADMVGVVDADMVDLRMQWTCQCGPSGLWA